MCRVLEPFLLQNTDEEEKCRIPAIFHVSAQYHIPAWHGSRGVIKNGYFRNPDKHGENPTKRIEPIRGHSPSPLLALSLYPEQLKSRVKGPLAWKHGVRPRGHIPNWSSVGSGQLRKRTTNVIRCHRAPPQTAQCHHSMISCHAQCVSRMRIKMNVGDNGPSSFLYGPNLCLLGYKTMLS